MTGQEAKLLLDKYEKGLCNAEEKALIESWYLNLSAEIPQTEGDPDYTYWNTYIKNKLPVRRQPAAFKLWPRIAGVAAVLAIITFGTWLYTSRQPDAGEDLAAAKYSNDIAPGRNTATLTLADGKTIALSDTKSAVIINASNLQYSDGSIVENGHAGNHEAAYRIMTASTPRGGTYQFILPDGSKVWLNAASSLKFPSTFNKSQMREVELSGEAYFEIAKNKKKPFVVKSKKMELMVLGTHFNVNAYEDENSTKATLLEGSIRIAGGSSGEHVKSIILKPNQQSILTADRELKVIGVDAMEAVAWKNNKFIFDSQRIEDIMRMVARWYNVEVIYTGEIPKETFWGSVSRFDNISKVLKKLESTDKVHFKIEGRKIFVSP